MSLRRDSSHGLKEQQSRTYVPSVILGADRCAARTRPVAWPVAPPERPGRDWFRGFERDAGGGLLQSWTGSAGSGRVTAG